MVKKRIQVETSYDCALIQPNSDETSINKSSNHVVIVSLFCFKKTEKDDIALLDRFFVISSLYDLFVE